MEFLYLLANNAALENRIGALNDMNNQHSNRVELQSLLEQPSSEICEVHKSNGFGWLGRYQCVRFRRRVLIESTNFFVAKIGKAT